MGTDRAKLRVITWRSGSEAYAAIGLPSANHLQVYQALRLAKGYNLLLLTRSAWPHLIAWGLANHPGPIHERVMTVAAARKRFGQVQAGNGEYVPLAADGVGPPDHEGKVFFPQFGIYEDPAQLPPPE